MPPTPGVMKLNFSSLPAEAWEKLQTRQKRLLSCEGNSLQLGYLTLFIHEWSRIECKYLLPFPRWVFSIKQKNKILGCFKTITYKEVLCWAEPLLFMEHSCPSVHSMSPSLRECSPGTHTAAHTPAAWGTTGRRMPTALFFFFPDCIHYKIWKDDIGKGG